jgi:hypothetical protein
MAERILPLTVIGQHVGGLRHLSRGRGRRRVDADGSGRAGHERGLAVLCERAGAVDGGLGEFGKHGRLAGWRS